ncbi:DMT family transporter [Salipaludibacillus aurantiacus]|uniref:Permease of the drug/metabolite transporter (DMT) superfamily n=1 Tax=Salipaludibacillus aurantiacus TaxID=1601833 RepID=A0A1H9S573_9BACI|nr:EamA family transporter [Salipaludibacillus aurantiacus]SER79513.1 Permease of the drug/metabolite transporter (DMT) superfamily [Salipaludibacillus aurantiacus]
MNRTLLGVLCLSLAASLWGGMFVFTKYVLNYIPLFTLIWLRYMIGFLVLYFLLKWHQKKYGQRKSYTKNDWLVLIRLGFIGYFVTIVGQYIGVELSNASTGALITASSPAFILIFARIMLKEKLTKRKITALLLATAGVIMTIEWDTSNNGVLLGSLVLFMAAISWSLFSVYVKLAARTFTSLETSAYGLLAATGFTTPLMVWELQRSEVYFGSPLIILSVLYLGIAATAGTFYLWNKGMELMDAGVGSLFLFFQPLVGGLLGWLWLNETIGLDFLAGGLLIMLGIVIATWKHKSKRYYRREYRKTGKRMA